MLVFLIARNDFAFEPKFNGCDNFGKYPLARNLPIDKSIHRRRKRGGGRGGGGGGGGWPPPPKKKMRGGQLCFASPPPLPNNPPTFSFNFYVKQEKITNVLAGDQSWPFLLHFYILYSKYGV